MSKYSVEAIKKSDRITYIVSDDEIHISVSFLRLCFIEIYDKAFSRKSKRLELWSKLLWSSLSIGSTLVLTMCTCEFKSFRFVTSDTLKSFTLGICVFAWVMFIISCIVLVSIDVPETRDGVISETLDKIKNCCSDDNFKAYRF